MTTVYEKPKAIDLVFMKQDKQEERTKCVQQCIDLRKKVYNLTLEIDKLQVKVDELIIERGI